MQRLPGRCHVVAQPVDFFLAFNIADKNGPLADQFLNGLAALLRPDRIQHIGAGFLEHAADMKGDAFAIRDAENQHRLAFEFKEIDGHQEIRRM
jgi:hypothetical protein